MTLPDGWTLRPYAPEDAPVFAELLLLGGRSTSADDLLAADTRRGPGPQPTRQLLVRHGEVLGGWQLQPSLFIPPDFIQVSVLVFPAARGQGVGQRLWQAAQQTARDLGPWGLSSDVPDADPAHRAWAERRSFTLRTHRHAS